MSIAAHIKTSLNLPSFVVQAYLQVLADDQLLIRPHEGANHIAWQLGHLIVSEQTLNNMVCPDSMPPLPEAILSNIVRRRHQVTNRVASARKTNISG